MSQKLINKIARQYSTFQMEGSEINPKDAKRMKSLIEADFKSGFATAMALLSDDADKLSMLKVILDQHFSDKDVNLEEVGRAVGICFGYI